MPARYIMLPPPAVVGWKIRAQFLMQKSRFARGSSRWRRLGVSA
jgi:hypothetical protein